MQLKYFTIRNFRKFSDSENKIKLAYDKFRKEAEESSKEKNKPINISNTSTLIVGKNNVGKTSIIDALTKLTGEEKFTATDFNLGYLQKFIDDYKKCEDKDNIELPQLEFTLEFELDEDADIVSIIAPILLMRDTTRAKLNVKVLIKEAELVKKELSRIVRENESIQVNSLLEAIDEAGLDVIYKSEDNQYIDKNFNLGDLIEVHPIEANKLPHQKSLSQAFNKIIKHRYKEDKNKDNEKINKDIEEINKTLSEEFGDNQAETVNESLNKIEHPHKLKIDLSSNLTYEKILDRNILLYQYKENGLFIPENQFGLGYSNLVMIIASIIEYIEKAPEESFSSQINIIAIEEPETNMHPQMQELFIKNINNAIEHLLLSHDKYAPSQIIITTHSPHILNSKIHSGNSFNYINYLTEVANKLEVINLSDNKMIDKKIIKNGRDKKQELQKRLEFLKKHIRFAVSELFFADAAIFVEGITEEVLIKNYIDQDSELHQYYITIFNIGGAHGLVYHNLIKKLKIPTLIITDIDIKKEKKLEENNNNQKEKDGNNNKRNKKSDDDENYEQVRSIIGRKTTNETLKYYYNSEMLQDIMNGKEINTPDNLSIHFQNEKEGFFPTSFEEALILKNYRSPVLKNALIETMPIIYRRVYKDNDENLKNKSRYLQKKLNNSSNKTKFSNNILLEILANNLNDKKNANKLYMPSYINDGLIWIKRQLKSEDKDA